MKPKNIAIDNRKINFTIIENEIIDEPNLNIYQKMAYIVLCRYAKDNQCFPSLATIASKLSCSKRKLQDTLKELQELGLIKIQNRKSDNGDNTSNLYTIIGIAPDAPPIAPDATPPMASGAIPPIAPDAPPIAPDATEQYLLNNINLLNNTNIIKNTQSVCQNSTDRMTELELFELKLKKQIGYDQLNAATDINLLNEIVLNILDMYFSEYVFIEKEKKLQMVVRGVINKLDYWCVDYIVRQYQAYTETIKNKKGFLRTLIFNAPFESTASCVNSYSSEAL